MIVCKSASEDVLKIVQRSIAETYEIESTISKVKGEVLLKQLEVDSRDLMPQFGVTPDELLAFADGAKDGATHAFRMVQSWEEEG